MSKSNVAYSYNSNGTLTIGRGTEAKRVLNVQYSEMMNIINSYCKNLNFVNSTKNIVKPKTTKAPAVLSKAPQGRKPKGQKHGAATSSIRNNDHRKYHGTHNH